MPRSIRHQSPLLLAAIAALGVACKKPSPSAAVTAAGDGGSGGAKPLASAAPPAPRKTGPFGAQILARLTSHPRIESADDGDVVLTSGVYGYTFDAEGMLARVGKPTDYATFFPDLDEDIGGYESTSLNVALRISGPKEKPYFSRQVFIPEQQEDVWHWDGGAFVKVPELPKPGPASVANRANTPSWDNPNTSSSISAEGLPTTHRWYSAAKAKDGRTVWLGLREGHGEETVIVDAKGKVGPVVTPIAVQRDAKGEASASCSGLPAIDGNIYLRCVEYDPDYNDRFQRKSHAVRLEGDAWKEIPIPPLAKESSPNPFAVDVEGTLWFAENASPPRMVRVPREGAAEMFELPHATIELSRPSYHSAPIPTRRKERGEPLRYWSQATIRSTPSADTKFETRYVSQVLPRTNGDVIALASDGHNELVLRFARGVQPLPTERVMLVGTAADQRNEVRNTRPPKTWIGHCAQIFVTLGQAGSDGALDTAKIVAREPEIFGAVKKAHRANKAGPQAAIVEGRLQGKHVIGVAILRTYPDVREEDVESTASRIIERFTKDPSSPPDATCTLPVLEKLHKDYPATGGGDFEGY